MALTTCIKFYDTHTHTIDKANTHACMNGDNLLANKHKMCECMENIPNACFSSPLYITPILAYINKQFKTLETFRLETMDSDGEKIGFLFFCSIPSIASAV